MPYIKENRQEMSRLYTQATNQLVAELPEGWTNFCLGFFVDSADRETMLIYISLDEGKNWHDFMDDVFEADEIFEGVFECKATCQELRQLCIKSGDKWSCFTLTVDAKGGFAADYDYEAFNELTPMLKRMWLGEYLA